MNKERWRLVVALVATAAILVPLAWLWQASRMPGEYSVMDMGYADYGGGPTAVAMGSMGHGHDMGPVSVPDLVDDPDRDADVTVELVARQQRFRLASGREVEGFTVNGTSPGPAIEVREGQLLEVHLRNEDVGEGITLHWHGVDVPNAEDGVAGVTQDAVLPGEEHTYRFVAEDAGTYWYHSHQVSHEQVRDGLLGALVVLPRGDGGPSKDVTALVHTYGGTATVNGQEGAVRVAAAPGQTVRVRAIDTDSTPLRVWSSTPYRVVAVDARDVEGPTPVDGRALTLGAGGRADLEVTVPDDGRAVGVHLGASSLVIGPPAAEAPMPAAEPEAELDLLTYGSPAPLPFDAEQPDRRFDYSIGRRPGFVDGKPGVWWTINGHMWPNVPMFMVAEGDVVRMTIENHSGAVHPMHLHGHHAVVLSRNGKAATGSPWWFDSLNVESGESYDVAFVADNPGVWMDHCHNLEHAADGLVAHLMYEDVTTPYKIGGAVANEPE